MSETNGTPVEVRFLLWPDAVLLTPKRIEHEGVKDGEIGIAWLISGADGWRETPIAQNSYPAEKALLILQGAELAEEAMKDAGGPKPGHVVMRYFAPTTVRTDDTLRATLMPAIPLNAPGEVYYAGAAGLETLRFPSHPEDPEDGEVIAALYPFSLGEVVRLPLDRVFPVEDWEEEYVDLFASAMGGQGEDYADRILKHATGGL